MNYCFPWLGIKAFAVDTLSKGRNYRIMEVDLGSTNAVDEASATLGRLMTLVMTLGKSTRVPGYIRTGAQFVGRITIKILN